MRVLVIAEHDTSQVRRGALSALGFANAVVEEVGGECQFLVLGDKIGAVADDAAKYAPVLVADSGALVAPTADCHAKVIADVVREHGFEMVVAASTTYAKDMVGRAAGILGGFMVSDVVGHAFRDSELLMQRPMFAGSITATVKFLGDSDAPKVVTVRPAAYPAAEAFESTCAITSVVIDETSLPRMIEHESVETKAMTRPDLTEARVVVSGGRAVKTSEDFEELVGGLADALGGAAGSTRALVDSGITPNELQVGQTGQVVAPELYVALGLSGAVQHLAGMKNSKVIVVVNKDPEAPIFEVADFGLVGDIYKLVPEMIEKLKGA